MEIESLEKALGRVSVSLFTMIVVPVMNEKIIGLQFANSVKIDVAFLENIT